MSLKKIQDQVLEFRKSYLKSPNPSLTATQMGWELYADTAGKNPVDGTGAVGGIGITWGISTVTPLDDEAGFIFVKDASNRQGQGTSIPFTIKNKHLGKVMKIEGHAELRLGTYINTIFNAQATYSVTSNVVTVTLPNSFTSGAKVTVVFESGGALTLSSEFTLTGATSTTFTFALTTGNTSGNCKVFYTGDVRLSIIEDPFGTPVVNEPIGTDLQLAIVGGKVKFSATFQTSVTQKNYRFCIHNSGSTTNAFSIGFDAIQIWEQDRNFGAFIGKTIEYTPVFQGFGTPTQIKVKYTMMGGICFVKGSFKSGSSTGVEARIGLPSGMVAETYNTSTGVHLAGFAIRDSTSAGNKFVVHTKNGQSYVNIGAIREGVAVSTYTSRNGNNIVNNGDDFSFEFSVPILGKDSGMELSNNVGDGRTVVGSYYGHTGVSLTANVTTLKINTKIRDTHGAYNPLTGVTTIPQAGDYVFMMSEIPLTTGNSAIQSYVNGVAYNGILNGILSGTNPIGFAIIIPDLKVGDTVDFRSNGSVTTSARPTPFSFFQINSGSQAFARDESVFVEAYCSTNRTTDSSTDLRWDTVTRDTHGAMNTTTGRFTAPMSKEFFVSIFMNPTVGVSTYVKIYVDGAFYKSFGFIASTGGDVPTFNTYVKLLKGQTLSIRTDASFTAAGSASLSTSGASNIVIKG